jgi:transposase
MKASTTSHRDFAGMEKRRVQAAKLFERSHSQAHVARQLGVSRQSANRWFAAWQEGGVDHLRGAGRAGRKPRLSSIQLQQLEQDLKRGPQSLGYNTPLWTARRVADLIERKTGVRFHPDHIYRLLQTLGWSCQRPVGRALERNEAAIGHWKRHRAPAIKKKPSPKVV